MDEADAAPEYLTGTLEAKGSLASVKDIDCRIRKWMNGATDPSDEAIALVTLIGRIKRALGG